MMDKPMAFLSCTSHSPSRIWLRAIATCAALCLVLLCVFEAADVLSETSSSSYGIDHAAITTRSYTEYLWAFADKFTWDSHTPGHQYSYKTLGSIFKEVPPGDMARVGKCTSFFGSHDYGYYGALNTHIAHNQRHRYPAYMLDRAVQDGLWSKHGALLQVLFQELKKPEKDRLEWLVWFDADTMILNQLISLETFLPPADMPDVHVIATRDWNGLNNGVFYLRVSTWSFEFLTAILAYRTFRPNDELPFTEQSAMEKLLSSGDFSHGAVFVPPHWFNAYPDGDELYKVRKGHMVLHFAGVGGKGNALSEWLYKLETDRSSWEVPLAETNITAEVERFWTGVRLKFVGS